MKTRSYRDLRVWREAMRLTTTCYELTRRFPADERFGLTSQIRRSATSVAANIAEGHGRFTRGEYLNFLSIANGSLRELETHVLTAQELRFLAPNEVARVIAATTSIGYKLVGLANALRAAGATARQSRAHLREGEARAISGEPPQAAKPISVGPKAHRFPASAASHGAVRA